LPSGKIELRKGKPLIVPFTGTRASAENFDHIERNRDECDRALPVAFQDSAKMLAIRHNALSPFMLAD
jgi:hypothetical protein